MQIISIPFNPTIIPSNIPIFRKFIRQEVNTIKHLFGENDIQTDLFHNHKEGAINRTHTITRYPRILYQIADEKPILVGMDEGCRAVNLLYQLKKHKWNLDTNEALIPKRTNVGKSNSIRFYKLFSWLGLKEDTFRQYEQILRLSDKIPILEIALSKNIYRFLQFSGNPDITEYSVFINEIHKSEFLKYKQFNLLAFDITFGCNLILPDNIGLGKACSHGFGRVSGN